MYNLKDFCVEVLEAVRDATWTSTTSTAKSLSPQGKSVGPWDFGGEVFEVLLRITPPSLKLGRLPGGFTRQGLLEGTGNKEKGNGLSRGRAWKGDRCMAVERGAVVEDLVKEYGEREVKGGFSWILLGFEDERVAVEGNGWLHWKEEKKLGGGAHQGQSDWSKTKGATDL
ncbi:hypothetical protein BY996DRAFT_6539862 [Phakopsora pachyrhizi]|nr:hypothetical protein BY996DRAFT_6539862 [Phakopsora pachyrhizi]